MEFANTKVNDIEFQTKAQVGPYVRIRYKFATGEEVSMPWAALILVDEDQCYLSDYVDIPQADLPLTMTEGFPHWKTAEDRKIGNVADFSTAKLEYDLSEGTGSPDRIFSMTIYYKMEPFPTGTFALWQPNPKQKLAQEVMARVLSTYKEGDIDLISKLWVSSRQQFMKRKFTNDKNAFAESVEFFKNSDDLKLEFYVASNSEMYLYARPVVGGQFGTFKLFRFLREDDQYSLAERMPSPAADRLLEHSAFLKILNRQVEFQTQAGWR